MNNFELQTIIQLLTKLVANGGTSSSYDDTNLLNKLDSIASKDKYKNPTHLGIVPAGDTTFDNSCVLCNITEENITVTVTAADDSTAQSIVLTPGWNPVVVKSITGATANTLIYGY